MVRLQIGERVRLIGYTEKWTDYDDIPLGELGTITANEVDLYDMLPPYNVQWDNGVLGGHFAEDIQLATEAPATAQPATEAADAGAGDTLAGVDKVGILEKYLREGEMISAIKAHRRFYGTDIGEADKALKLMKYDMQLREDSQPSYTELQAKLAAAETTRDAVVEVANDYRDQIWVHQGTLRVLKSWLSKAVGFRAEDGYGEGAILRLVERDLEVSEKMDTRTLQASEKVVK